MARTDYEGGSVEDVGNASADEHEEVLAGALIGGGQRERLYWTSASFKMSIDTLASMLPLWIDALAEAARVSDRDTAVRREALKLGPIDRTVFHVDELR